MEITFINVGYGDAVLIQEQGYTVLLDGGSALPEEFAGNADRLPAVEYLKARAVSGIDLLVISHIHEDHVCGLETVMDQIPVRELRMGFPPELFMGRRELTPSQEAPRSVHLFTAALNAMIRLTGKAAAENIPIHTLTRGDCLPLTDSLELRVLAPKPAVHTRFVELLERAFQAEDPTGPLTELDRLSNGTSLLLSAESGGMGCLLPGDSCPRDWDEVDISLLKIENVLKIPHHGQKDCISEEIYREMPLKAVVTTASSDRRYNSANPTVYEAIHRLHPRAQLLFIDERDYPPYFANPQGCQAIQLVMDSGEVYSEFIKIQKAVLE